jgi:hypothetical protein
MSDAVLIEEAKEVKHQQFVLMLTGKVQFAQMYAVSEAREIRAQIISD